MKTMLERFNDLPDLRACMNKAGYTCDINPEYGNMEKYRDKAIEDNNLEFLEILETKGQIIAEEKEKIAYKKLRSDEYEKEGLSFYSFVELLIENDASAMAQFRAKRDAIKSKHPKPMGV